MRDLLIVGLVLWGSLLALRRPWIGVLVWTWLSLMNPHRYAYGFSATAPLAAIAAASTLGGMLFCKDKESPFKGAPVWWFALFVLWVTISWLNGVNPTGDYEQWNKVMKIDLMLMVALVLLRTRQQILALMAVTTVSLALLGLKGGVFTLLNGGSYRVWGPPGSFIEDNNEFALAMVMTVPMLRFMQLQLRPTDRWLRHGFSLAMLLCAASALGSHSRGGLLAITAMTVFLWWRSKNKLVGGMVLSITAALLIAFMPSEWTERMETIKTYEQDASSMGRLSAWSVAWGVAKDYPTGAGFNVARRDFFDRYSWYRGTDGGIHAAHSIYFQVLGNHGFVGLILFLGIWVSTWRMAGRIRRDAESIPEAAWAGHLASMLQVSLLGYAVGGAFLSLAYFDLPYNLMVLTVLTRCWIDQKRWKTEPPLPQGWRSVIGLSIGKARPKRGPAVSV